MHTRTHTQKEKREMCRWVILSHRRENCQCSWSEPKFYDRVNEWGFRTLISKSLNRDLLKYRRNVNGADTWQIPPLQIVALLLFLSVTLFLCPWSQKGCKSMWWSTHNILSVKKQKIITKQRKIKLYQLIESLTSIEVLLSTIPLNKTPFN